MGSVEKASALLHYWIGQHRPNFDPDATSSFEATVAHSIQEITTDVGMCSCKLLVTQRIQNNYGGLNGGCMAALTCIIAGAALETVSARSGVVTSSSLDCLSAMPGDAIVQVIAKVSAVTSASASVDVILQDATSHKLVAKARYTEQAPHTMRARASAYLTNAASAARSAVHRLQTAAESALQYPDSSSADQSSPAESDPAPDIKQKAMTSLTSAGATVRAAAHRLQMAADSVLRSSLAGVQQAQTDSAKDNADSTETGNSPTTELAKQFTTAANSASTKVEAAASVASANMKSAAQSAMNAASSNLSPDNPQQSGRDSQTSSSELNSQGADSTAANGPVPERAKQALLQRIALVKDGFQGDDSTCFDTTIGCGLTDIQVQEGRCSAVLPITARLANQQGQLHAGCFCSLVDLISTTALAAADRRPAVSVTISVDFYAPVLLGEDLEVEAHMVKAGKTLTFAEVNFRHRSSGELIAQGSHVEYSAGGVPYPDTIEEYDNNKKSRRPVSSKL